MSYATSGVAPRIKITKDLYEILAKLVSLIQHITTHFQHEGTNLFPAISLDILFLLKESVDYGWADSLT